ncbi:hypothetical protein [Mycobacterium ostraviense]|uniref:Serine/threonine protein kinase n=1 Tax=Mycobacterium ostraviense TaxID=2738409 RepID=A0A164EQ09_9MYCO|nr:hypothetical protein [Mycobacterium ostraviense]KZS67822.1 hypothetical protein A4G28_26910 [Mycobacterium ostraviense]UGT93780.1 hypothetical protein LTS72_11460 [Mycobacterium ostraviense]
MLVVAASAAAAIAAPPAAGADPVVDLMGRLPPGYSESSCHSLDGPLADPGAIAMVECLANSLPGGPTGARYTLFRDTGTLENLFKAIHSHHFKAAACPGSGSTPASWTRPDGKPGGSIACGEVEGDIAAVMWTNDSGPLFALAQGGSETNNLPGPGVDGLWQWWSSSVLPV